jgi:uncharacterized repeat protein (TIGR01451 family)
MLLSSLIRRITGAIFGAARLLLGIAAFVLVANQAWAVGTGAGREIQNTAQAAFSMAGNPQVPISSNVVQTYVDELIDVTVVNDDGGAVGVASPQTGAVLQFTVSNIGNGNESFRLVADAAVGGGIFNPLLNQLYLEINGVPGLQIGGGGDTAYLAGSNDPTLAPDTNQLVYVQSDIPASQGQGDEGIVELRAVANTIFANAGTDDPDNVAFPDPGEAYAGAGDADENGSGNVTAVVGTTVDSANRLIGDEGIYRVTAAVVSLVKTSTTILDPFGGTTLVPGTLITYQIDVSVTGTGGADNLIVSDPIPADLEYQPGTLSVSALPAGEDSDDDFAPSGTDNTGFDGGNQTVTVNLATVSGGAPGITITFQAAIR